MNTRKNTSQINFYGFEDNYIHLIIKYIGGIVLLACISLGLLMELVAYHNRAGGYCDHARGTQLEYNINYIFCK